MTGLAERRLTVSRCVQTLPEGAAVLALYDWMLDGGEFPAGWEPVRSDVERDLTTERQPNETDNEAAAARLLGE